MYLITSNKGKFSELKLLIPELEQLDLELPEIQSADAREIIATKLEAARAQHAGSFLVEDTGLYFRSLNGLPGPLVKWFLEKLGADGLAKLALQSETAEAEMITWLGYSDHQGDQHFFSGTISGTIVEPRGNNGFGWDVIFQPTGHNRTFAEMEQSEKNQLSARSLAAANFVQFLKN